jgi:hypothetical protein
MPELLLIWLALIDAVITSTLGCVNASGNTPHTHTRYCFIDKNKLLTMAAFLLLFLLVLVFVAS